MDLLRRLTGSLTSTLDNPAIPWKSLIITCKAYNNGQQQQQQPPKQQAIH